MDAEVFSSSAFKEATKDLILVHINGDNDQATAQAFGVSGYPTIVFLNSKAQEVHRVPGYMPLEAFLQQVQAAKSKM